MAGGKSSEKKSGFQKPKGRVTTDFCPVMFKTSSIAFEMCVLKYRAAKYCTILTNQVCEILLVRTHTSSGIKIVLEMVILLFPIAHPGALIILHWRPMHCVADSLK